MTNRNGGRTLRNWMSVSMLILGCAATAVAQDSPHPANEAHAEHAADAAHSDAEPAFEIRRQESFLMWMLRSLGAVGLMVFLAGCLCLAFTALITIRGNGPYAAAALILIVPIPLLLGIFGGVQGAVMSFQVIASSSATPKPSELADGISTALFNPLFGLVMTAPSLAVAILGSLFRSFPKQPS